LGSRAHSRTELVRKLRTRKFSRTVIDNVCADLERTGLIDDRAFARLFCETKSSGRSAWGPGRIESALRKRGVAPEIAVQAIGQINAERSPAEQALEIARSKWGSLRQRNEPRKAREKAIRFLAGRGYGVEACCRAVDQVMQEDRDARGM